MTVFAAAFARMEGTMAQPAKAGNLARVKKAEVAIARSPFNGLAKFAAIPAR